MDDVHAWTDEAGWSADGRHVAEARAFATRCLTDHRMVPQVDDVRLVVSELATNAVVHADTGFTVVLTRLDGLLTVTVRDGSSVWPDRPRQQLAMELKGRGLHLVQALSSSWGVTDEVHGKSVWATFDVAPASSPGR